MSNPVSSDDEPEHYGVDRPYAAREQPPNLSDWEAVQASRSPEQEALETEVEGWLLQQVRVHVTDGRVVCGVLHCVDSDANLVLLEAYNVDLDIEEPKFGDQKHIGKLYVPGKYIDKLEVLVKDEGSDEEDAAAEAGASAEAAT